jgi:hypothetical protein
MADAPAERKPKRGVGYYTGLFLLVALVGVLLVFLLQNELDGLFPNEYYLEKAGLYLVVYLGFFTIAYRFVMKPHTELFKQKREEEKREGRSESAWG